MPRLTMKLTREQRQAARDELKDIMARGDSPALAALIREVVEIAPPIQDMVRAMIGNVGTFNHGDEIEFDVKEGVTAYIITHGAEAVRDQVSTGWIKPESIQVSCFPTVNILDLRAGKYEGLLDVANDVDQAFLKQGMYYVFNLLRKAVGTTDTNYTSIGGATVTQTELDDMIATIDDAAGGAVSVIGRRTTLQPICNFTGYSNETLRGIEVTGWWQGTYRGANLIALPQIKDEWGLRKRGGNLISTTDIVVVGTGAAAYRETAVDMLEEVDVGTLRQGWHHFKEIVGAVVNPAYIGRLEIGG